MTAFGWKGSVSGFWANDSLWAGGVAPRAADADVSLAAAGPYTVTVGAGTSVRARSIAGAAGVTLDVAGALALSGNASLARLVVVPAGRLASSEGISVTGELVNQGLLSADTPGAFLQLLSGTVTNAGTFAAPATGSYLFVNGATLTNLSSGTLSGGTWLASGEATGGAVAMIDIARAGQSTEIATLAATVVLSHVNSAVMGRSADGTPRQLEATLATIAPGGELRLLAGRNFSSAQALSVGGRLELGGGTLAATGGLSVVAGGTLAGFGRVTAPVSLAGTLHASGGVLRLSGAVTGSGTVRIDQGATLQVPGGSYAASFGGQGVLRAASGTVALAAPLSGSLVLQAPTGTTIDIGTVAGGTLVFAGTNAKLAFAGAGAFGGVIAGMQSTDVLQLKDVAAMAAQAVASGADSRLLLSTAGGTVALRLAGDYSDRSFQVAPDGAGGTLVTVSGVSFAPGAAAWTSPVVTWSFAQANYAGALAGFSSFVNPAAQSGMAALWRAAFARWAQVSGLTFEEVADTPDATGQADIRVGWGNFGDPPAGEIGQANYTYIAATRAMLPGALVRLQDPSVTPLADSGGVLVYEGTVSSAYQVMLHEIGHALGLDHGAVATDPASAMTPTASDANRDLDISDIAGIRALYAAVAPAPVAATLSIAALAASKLEGTGSGVSDYNFEITRSGDITSTATVNYAVTGSGANPANPADFGGAVFPAGTVSFTPGMAKITLLIPMVRDSAVEPDEGFTVTLSDPTGATITTASADGVILNDDVTVLSIAAFDAVKLEGPAGSTTDFTFTVSRGETSLGAISLDYAVAPGAMRPTDAADFVGNALPSGTVSFAADATQATITIPVAGDDVQEPNETFTVTLANAPANTLFAGIPPSATGIILADEPILDLAAIGSGGKAAATSPGYFSGPVAGVEKELVLVTDENLTIAVGGPNWFIHTGTGDDAIAAASGTNVLDGGTGSNFLTGGSGADTFFVDARGTTLPIWSTVRGFDPGDQATLWGVSDATHTLTWADDEGAEGYKGLTLHAASPGNPDVLMTLPGFAKADLGIRLAVFTDSFDPASGSPYTFVYAL